MLILLGSVFCFSFVLVLGFGYISVLVFSFVTLNCSSNRVSSAITRMRSYYLSFSLKFYEAGD